MSQPFYVAPEQMTKDRADFARKGIARGRSVVVVQYADGILFVAENPSTSLHKISEIYDRIAFAGNAHIDMAWLWRMEETVQVCYETFASALDFADIDVAILDRRRKVTSLERRAHAFVFARRDLATKDQGLGATT